MSVCLKVFILNDTFLEPDYHDRDPKICPFKQPDIWHLRRTCKSVGVNDLRAPPKVPKGVLLAATTNTDLERDCPTADILLLIFDGLIEVRTKFESKDHLARPQNYAALCLFIS